MAQIGTVTVEVKVVGMGRSKIGLRILGLIARIFKINLDVVSKVKK